ncbi:hypothetical protein LBMAG42_20140 [Deltaproteobacteria bacterium]|nr:hypothetical protein LBMAG42_20140 [Deltaproteobacteria bacterium]
MSKKTPPPDDDLGFGDFFDSAPSGFEEDDAKKAAEALAAEEARVAAEAAKAEAAKAEAAKAEAKRLADERAAAAAAEAAAAAAAAEAKQAEKARLAAEEAKRREEDARQAELEADARRAAKTMQDQATRVYKRKSKAEILAEEDAEGALVGTDAPAADAAEPTPALSPVASVEPEPEPVVPVVEVPAPELAPTEPALAAASVEVAVVEAELPAEAPPPPVLVGPTLTMVPEEDEPAEPSPLPLLLLLPPVTSEDAMETEVVSAPSTEEMPLGAPVIGQEPASSGASSVMLAWTPPADARAAWRVAVAELEAAAEAASGETKAVLYGAAAHLARTRSVDLEVAGRLLSAANAASASPASAQWWRERVSVALAVSDGEAARAAFEGVAAQSTGSAAAESLVLAARVIRDQLGQEPLARAELMRAQGMYPNDPGLLVVLRELARSAQDAALELSALDAMAAAQPAAVAALTHLERADLLERKLGRTEEAIAASEAARAADPGSSAAFLALERRYRASGAWAPLAALYSAEGERLSAAGLGEDGAWWHARAGRVRRVQLLDETSAGVSLRAAVLSAPAAHDLRHEYHVWCAEAEQWDALAESLREEIAVAGADARSFLQYRLGNVLEERLALPEEALVAYQAAAEDPGAAPAAEAVLRLLQIGGKWSELVNFLEERLARLDDPSLMVTVLYRMGETCEGPLADQGGARKHYERVLDFAPGYLPALEGLERVYTRVGAWAELAAIYEQRALIAEDPPAVALQRHRAGAVYEFRLADQARAFEQYRLALTSVADFAPSLDAYTRAMELRDDWTELARVLRNAASATRDSNEAVSLYYRAGRVLADRTPHFADAMTSLQKCLEVSPGFLPAVLLLKELAARQGDWSMCYRLERGQADMSEDLGRRHWRLYAAAEAAQRLPDADPAQLVRDVLRDDPAHFGAGQLAERMAWSQSDLGALIDLLVKRANATQDEGERARCYARATELAADAGNSEVLLRGLGEVLSAASVAGRPLGALARVAETAGYPEEALRALREAGEAGSVDAARLHQNALGDGEGAARLLVAAMDHDGDVAAASMLTRTSRDPAVRARAHAALAAAADSAGVRALHATEAAVLREGLGEAEEALALWWTAFEADPRAGRAFDGLRSALVRGQDAEGLRTAFAAVDADAQTALGDALEEAGDVVGAIAAWREQLAKATVALPWQLRLERGLETAGDWRGLLELVQSRMATAMGDAQDRLAARARWLLAEKLSDSDEAWDFYQALHTQRPHDGEVLEALARIAGARGDQRMAVGFLDQLADQAKDPVDRARLQRRRAEVLERSGDVDGARAALTRALDHMSEDREALEGLERLAAAAGDWQSVVGVLARQAAITTGKDRVERFAQIARTWQDHLKDAVVATDAWKKVLDLAPNDREALGHLCVLNETSGDWIGFVEHGRNLAGHLAGKERSALLRRLGEVCAQQLRREEDALRFLEAATQGDSPDAGAYAGFERLLAARGEHARLADVLVRRARSTTDAAEKVESLARAARTRLESLQDKPGAAAIYDELLAIDPNQADALRYRGDFLFDNGDAAGAAALFERLEAEELGRDRDDFDAQIEGSTFFYRFAEALRRAGRTEEAIVRYEHALNLNTTHLASLDAVGPLYLGAKEWAKAEKVFKQVMQLTGGQGQSESLARTYARLGIAEFHLGHIDRARKRLSKALEMRTNDIDALKGLGLVMAAQADWNSLLNVYNNIIYHTHEPSDVTDAYLAKGLVLDARLNMPEKAAQHYEKSLAFDPSQPLALLRLAELGLRRQDWPEAAAQADRGMALDPQRGDVRAGLHLVRAIACQACGDAGAARDAWTAAQAADPSLLAALPASGVEDYDKVHELLRTAISDGRL